MNIECEFCGSHLKDVLAPTCEVCGFPVKGSEEAQEKFKLENEELKALIDESETALSWARFAMLWPSLALMITSGFLFLTPPVNIGALFSSWVLSSFFISAFFAVKKKPLLVLSSVFTIFILENVISLFIFRDLITFNFTFFSWMIVPVIILIMYGNALYLQKKFQKVLKERKHGHHEG